MSRLKLNRWSLLVLLFLFGCDSRESQQQTLSPALMTYSHGGSEVAQAISVSSDVAHGSKQQPHSRMIIKTANLSIEVAEYNETFARIQTISERSGGFVVSSGVTSHDERQKAGTVSMRVPSKKFEETLSALKKLASKIENESISGNDVTEEFYDVAARLQNKEKAEKRFQEILRAAKSVKEILEVEQALTNVREEIERLTARKRFLADQVELSTISVSMHEPYPVIALGSDGFLSKVVKGFQLGVDRFGDAVSFIVAFFIMSLPFWVVAFVLLTVGLKYYRRYKSREVLAAK
jgi:hypothetical protein